MTLTIELSPEREQALREAAARKGVPVAELASALFHGALQDLEQDRIDGEEAMRILANSNPEERRTLDDLRQAFGKGVG